MTSRGGRSDARRIARKSLPRQSVAGDLVEAVRAGGGQRVGDRGLAVRAQRRGGFEPGSLVEAGEVALDARPECGRQVFEKEKGVKEKGVSKEKGVCDCL